MLDFDPNDWLRTLLSKKTTYNKTRTYNKTWGVSGNTTRSYFTTHVKQEVDAITPISFAAGESQFTLRDTPVCVHRAFNTYYTHFAFL